MSLKPEFFRSLLGIAFGEAGLVVQCQVPISVSFRHHCVGDFKADMVIENKVLIELKAARNIDMAHEKQLLNYLRATEIEVGLLLNFGAKPEFRRLVFENHRKIRVHRRKSAAERVFA